MTVIKIKNIMLKMKRTKRLLAVFLAITAYATFSFTQILETLQEDGSFSRYLAVNLRDLSVNLGNGKCIWTPPEPLHLHNEFNTTTLIASYPGSGKRLVWRIIEALTGTVTGDDWDLSENGENVLFIKTSYPHPEGIWSWKDNMDQSMMLIRSFRWALPSYHTMRYELDYSDGWNKSYIRRNFTYTVSSSNEEWEAWRDSRFDVELSLWSWFIDFWMQNGLRTDGTEDYQDYHCQIHMEECHPKILVQYEKLYNVNKNIGQAESEKIARLIESSSNITIIDEEAWPCIYNSVVDRTELFNPNRNGKGPPVDQKGFTCAQLEAMMTEMTLLRDKYSVSPWDQDSVAADLVYALDEYIFSIGKEYNTCTAGGNKLGYYDNLP